MTKQQILAIRVLQDNDGAVSEATLADSGINTPRVTMRVLAVHRYVERVEYIDELNGYLYRLTGKGWLI